jgi:hypothetical protein
MSVNILHNIVKGFSEYQNPALWKMRVNSDVKCYVFMIDFFRNSTPDDLYGDGVDGQELCSTTFDNSPAEVYFQGLVQNEQLSSPPQKAVGGHPADKEESKEQSKTHDR